MVGMIGRFGEVSPRRAKICAWLHLAGNVAGAAALGALLGTVGMGFRASLAWVAGGRAESLLWLGASLTAAYCALLEMGLIRVRLLERRRQVSQDLWFRAGPYPAAFHWGIELGVGFRTHITFP